MSASTSGIEGFGPGARMAVNLASAEARNLGSNRLGTEHLLLGLLAHRDGGAAQALGAAGVTLAAGRRKVAEAVGQRPPADDALDRSPRAERAIGRAFRFAQEGRSKEVRTEHLLLGVLDVEGTAGQVLRGLGIDIERLRAALELPRADDAPDGVDTGVPASSPAASATVAVSCANCAAPLADALSFQILTATDDDGRKRDVIVVSCRGCGAAVGIAR